MLTEVNYQSEIQMSIFEKACQTPQRKEFITECILIGCDVNKVCFRLHQNGKSV